jgi:hypothetical protein
MKDLVPKTLVTQNSLTMASKTALFGDDSDDDSDASDNDPKTQPAAWDNNDGATAEELGGGKKETKKGGMEVDSDAVAAPVKPDLNKGGLFGDDDSSEDDKFDGADDGIVE